MQRRMHPAQSHVMKHCSSMSSSGSTLCSTGCMTPLLCSYQVQHNMKLELAQHASLCRLPPMHPGRTVHPHQPGKPKWVKAGNRLLLTHVCCRKWPTSNQAL